MRMNKHIAAGSAVKGSSTGSMPWMEFNLSAGGRDELRRWQRHMFEKLYTLLGYPCSKRFRKPRRPAKLARETKEPRLGPFFFVNGKLLENSKPWSLIPPFAGYRTNGNGLWDLWESLRRTGKVPPVSSYTSFARGRVSYNEAAGRFIVYADKCVVADQGQIQAIKKRFRLPPTTKIVADDHYACQKCLEGMPKPKDLYWFLDSNFNFFNTLDKVEN